MSKHNWGAKKRGGYIYVVHCVGTPYYKIGICYSENKNSFKARLVGLQTGCPFELKYVATIWKEFDISLFEHTVQRKCQKCCIRGEWFEFNENQITKLIEELGDDEQS